MSSCSQHLTTPSVNRRFAQITSPLALSSISLIVEPPRLSIGLFVLSGNPSIKDWCTTLHFMLQNVHYFVRATDYLLSQIITLLPRLTTLHIRVQFLARADTTSDQTVAALASLKHIEDISFTMVSECTTYSTQILRNFASSIRTLSIHGGHADWFIGDASFSESHPFLDGNCNISRPWSFPNLRSLELRNVNREAEIYAQIPFDTPLVTLALSFSTLLRYPTAPCLQRRRVQRLVLWVPIASIPPKPRAEHGPSADILDLIVPIESTEDLPLATAFGRLHGFVCSLSDETTRKVTWKMECSTPELCTKLIEELQEPSIIAILHSLAAACHEKGLQWELEGPGSLRLK